MHKVMGGSLPARLWHDAMLFAHEGRAPEPLPGMSPASIALLATGATRQPATPHAGTPPLIPRERIGADFIERATATDDAPATAEPSSQPSGSGWQRAAKGLLRGLGFGT
jgi:hypothetical protein